MKQKGIFYSIITLLLLIPIVIYVISYLDMTGSQLGYSKTKMTGEKLSAFVSSIDDDLPRSLGIIGKQAIAVSIIYIDSNGEPLDDANRRITEVMMNNTIYGNPANISRSTLLDWAASTATKGSRYGFITNVSIRNLTITEYDSFHIMVGAEIIVNSTDSSGKMRLDKRYDERVQLSIEGFGDPLYTLNTNGLLSRTIKQTNLTMYGIDAVDTAVAQKLYMPNNDAPSFLDRLEGRLSTSDKYRSQTANIIGIETFVQTQELSSVGLPIKQSQSDIDHYYFSSSSYTGSPVNGSAYSWLRLDSGHAAFYGVSLAS
ncbi:MAG: hypothetical protein HZB67_01950 [Candidatus Aenigmarchaeota archaeon]|nr:hypothetical protein [Candidatus Aenigmarchaeota archaeon]